VRVCVCACACVCVCLFVYRLISDPTMDLLCSFVGGVPCADLFDQGQSALLISSSTRVFLSSPCWPSIRRRPVPRQSRYRQCPCCPPRIAGACSFACLFLHKLDSIIVLGWSQLPTDQILAASTRVGVSTTGYLRIFLEMKTKLCRFFVPPHRCRGGTL
jgi:hypothetical protein